MLDRTVSPLNTNEIYMLDQTCSTKLVWSSKFGRALLNVSIMVWLTEAYVEFLGLFCTWSWQYFVSNWWNTRDANVLSNVCFMCSGAFLGHVSALLLLRRLYFGLRGRFCVLNLIGFAFCLCVLHWSSWCGHCFTACIHPRC